MTYAKVILKNQTNSDLKTAISDADGVMNLDPFFNLKLDPYKNSDWVKIETHGLGQSRFKIKYLNGDLGIDLGLGLFRTAVTSNTNPNQIQAVLAPEDAFIVTGFKFYFYGGPGVVTSLINSVVNANLAALTKAISQHPLADGIINSVNVSSFSCLYAAAVPVQTNVLDFSVILKMSGSMSGKLGQVVSVTDLIILLEGRIDFSSGQPKISATLFKCSMEKYEIPVGVLIALAGAVPFIGPFLMALVAVLALVATPVALAAKINDNADLNKKIIDAINGALEKI
jgi:hypothetical protein